MPAETFESLQQSLWGQYVLEREIGRGGMGIVYLAREVRLDRAVAVKVLPREMGGNPELRERFLREARTAAQLSHPNIVPILRADEIDQFAFFTMPFIDGENLAERLRARGALAPADAVRILRETAWALAYAHARGLVHRDVKPENIMIERGTGRAIVTDFGIARNQLATPLTQDGMVLGSVHYMSPEQATGDPLDGRSDLYSLGVVGFQLLSGRLPFDAEQAAAVLVQQVTRPAPPLASVAPDVPRALAAVIDRCLAKSPADRYPNGEALAEALTAALEATPHADIAGTHNEIIGTTQARAIWLRAAQLQAEASTRLQARYRESAAAGSEIAPVATGGYRLQDVESAAAEAGIAADYIALALAERPGATAAVTSELSPQQEQRLTRMLGTSDRSIACSRVIRATPRAVLEAIGRIFPVHPFGLALRDTVGGHPLDGGVMVFDVPQFRSGQIASPMGANIFSYRMTQIELQQLNVVLKPIGSPADACEVTVYGDLRRGLQKNWRADKGFAAGAAAAGGGGGAAVGLAALSLGPLAIVTAVAGSALLGGASLAWYRWLYRYALRKSGEELERLVTSVEENLRAMSVFGSAPPDPFTGLLRGTSPTPDG